MSDRNKTHNGRDRDGNFRVKHEDVDDLLEDPRGEDFLRDDVRLGGAVADTGPLAGRHGDDIGRMIDQNREEVDRARLAGRGPGAEETQPRSKGKRKK